MNNSIVIISLNYYPENTAIGLYSTQMANYLQKRGWDVTVITGFPYYPQWEIYPNYKNKKKYIEEVINKVRILRYRQFVPDDPTFVKRIIQIIDFTAGNYFNIKTIKKTNIVLSVIPFTSSAWLGKILSKKLNVPHWIHIQDFEFDIVLNTETFNKNKNSTFIKKKLFNNEKNLLSSANIVSSISLKMIEKIQQKTTTETFFFPNWIDENSINPSIANRHTFLKSEKFKILYAGNIGEKQDWTLFLKLLDHFKSNFSIEFIVVGNGSYKKKLIHLTKSIKNLYIFDTVPLRELNDLLCSANLHILFQKEDVADTVMPSKLLGMMASEVSCLITGHLESRIAKIMNEGNIGYYYSPGDFKTIINTIEKVMRNDDEAKIMAKNARKYIIDNFSSKKVLDTFYNKLLQINEG